MNVLISGGPVPAGGRYANRHAQFSASLGDPLDVAFLQHGEAGIDTAQDPHAPHRIVVGVEGDHPHILAGGQRVPHLDDDLRRLRPHIRDPGADLHGGRIARSHCGRQRGRLGGSAVRRRGLRLGVRDGRFDLDHGRWRWRRRVDGRSRRAARTAPRNENGSRKYPGCESDHRTSPP